MTIFRCVWSFLAARITRRRRSYRALRSSGQNFFAFSRRSSETPGQGSMSFLRRFLAHRLDSVVKENKPRIGFKSVHGRHGICSISLGNARNSRKQMKIIKCLIGRPGICSYNNYCTRHPCAGCLEHTRRSGAGRGTSESIRGEDGRRKR